jgi:hypothetical protein
MPVERLTALLAQPQAWPAGWGDWEVTHRAHRLAADRFLTYLPPYPAERYRGRGCVIAGGGLAYFPSLYVTVRALRHVGWTLPIQVWYLGRDDELPGSYQALLERWSVECVDADRVRTRHPCRILNGWELKAYAVLHAPFEEVLCLDADCYPVRDPALLFNDADYGHTGAIFWPDLRDGPPLDWRPFGVTAPGRVSIESGQFVVNKRLCWQPLQLAWWYNDHSDWSYLHGYGDKHTFEVAWARCGRRYTRFGEEAAWSVHSFTHVGPEGQWLFIHRCKDKFRFGAPDYLNPQAFAANYFHADLPLEAECFSWLRELGDELGVGAPPPAISSTEKVSAMTRSLPTLGAWLYTCPERALVCAGTLRRWQLTDWGEVPTVVVDDGTPPTSTVRLLANARRTLTLAATQHVDYYLFLEDDLLFNPHLRHNLLHWQPLSDGWLWMGSLFNPGLAPDEATLTGNLWRTRHFQATADGYYGALAFVLSRAALTRILRDWETQSGAFDLRLGALAQRHAGGVVMHVPSLVQHMPVTSTWGGVPVRSPDFDPFYRA